MHRTPTSLAVSLAALAAIALAACDDEDTTTTTLSRDGWIDEVNTLCVAHNDALGAIIGPLFAAGEPSPDAAQAALDEIVQRSRDVTATIGELPEPSALTVHVDALVAALEAGSDEAAALGGAAFFGSPVDPYRRAQDIAGELGLDACDTEA